LKKRNFILFLKEEIIIGMFSKSKSLNRKVIEGKTFTTFYIESILSVKLFDIKKVKNIFITKKNEMKKYSGGCTL